MIIRKAKTEDAEEISKLRIDAIKKLNSQDHEEEEMAYLLDRQTLEILKKKIKSREVYVMTENKKIIGSVDLDDNEIKGLYVLSNRIKEGIGTKLLKFIEEIAKNKGIKIINICSTKSAIPFYKKNGYKLIEIKKSIEKGIMMTRHLMQK